MEEPVNGYFVNMLLNDQIDVQDHQQEANAAANNHKAGVKNGSKRGKYEKSTDAVRARVIASAEVGEDWVSVAAANGVKQSTAYNWVRKGTPVQSKRGGVVQARVKLHQQHIEALIDMLNENPLLTLREMGENLQVHHGVLVSKPTIMRYLEGRMISLKQIHMQPVTANSIHNKVLRKEYVQRVMQATGEGKYVMYVDESNVNLFLRRSHGRAAIGCRAVVKLPTSKGANIHMIGAITQTGFISFKRKRGSYKMENCNAWLREILQDISVQGVPLNNIVIVIDNAPCHSRAEQVVDQFPGVSILRLAPYSPMLNPIEMAWGVMKSYLKQKEAATLPQLLAGNQNGLTQTEWRLRFVENLIDEAQEQITPMKCMRFVNHSQIFFGDAMALKDMPVGE
jgi:transposase